MIISLPRRLVIDNLLPFLQQINDHKYEEDIVIDFSPVNYSFPLAMLVIGRELRRFVKQRYQYGLQTKATGISNDNNSHSYLMHLGFFDYINIKAGKKIGQASGSQRYMPIKEIKREHISSKVSYPYIQEQHVIRDLSLSLSNLILQSPNTENGNVVSYSIRETIRNVFEHSRSNSCFIAGQKWHNGSVQIAIIDEGIGIYNSLSKEYNINDNRKALELCIQPGISGQKIKLESDLNSGYGLYVLSKLGARYGWFMIGSGNNILRLSRNARIKDTIYHGTFVGIHINNLNSLIFSFDKILEEIINTGELEAYEKGRATCASASSKLPY